MREEDAKYLVRYIDSELWHTAEAPTPLHVMVATEPAGSSLKVTLTTRMIPDKASGSAELRALLVPVVVVGTDGTNTRTWMSHWWRPPLCPSHPHDHGAHRHEHHHTHVCVCVCSCCARVQTAAPTATATMATPAPSTPATPPPASASSHPTSSVSGLV